MAVRQIGDTVVVVLPDHLEYLTGTSLVPTATVGPNTYHHDYAYTYTSTNKGGEEEVVSMRQVFDCTFSGCPVATTGTCNAERVSGTSTGTGIVTLGPSDLTFYPLTLATPLPESLPNSCGNGGGDNEAKPTGSEATATANNSASPTSGDESAPKDAPSGGWRVSVPWPGLVSAVCLISAVI